MCELVDQEPNIYEEAAQKKEWVEAMTEEYQSIMKNDVWDIVPKLENKSVARGFSQKEGIDYEEAVSPLASYTSKTIMALASMMKWDLHHMDVKTTFLNGVIEEEVYVEQPKGFEV